jgi:hypothetical protein
LTFYEFIVRDDPDIDFADFEAETGLRCTRSGRAARLDGELVDSAALHGALARLFQLGVDLVAIERRRGPQRAAVRPSRNVTAS